MTYVEGGPPETEADWRRVAGALRQLHRVTQGWPQRPGWRSSTGLLHAETGTRVDLGAMPPEGVVRCRAAWARLTGRTTCVVHGDPNPGRIPTFSSTRTDAGFGAGRSNRRQRDCVRPSRARPRKPTAKDHSQGIRSAQSSMTYGPDCAVGRSADWLPAWCLHRLSGAPTEVLFRYQQQLEQISMVFGLRLAGGIDVVVKACADDGRAASCAAAQARLADRGFPCARPLTPVTGVESLAVHAEEFRPGGEMLDGDSPEVAARYAEVFAWLMAELADVTVTPPLPNPPWVRWDHTDPGVWPVIEGLDAQDQDVVPAHAVDIAVRDIR